MALLNTLLLFIATLLIPGIAHQTRARLTGHKGGSLLHPTCQAAGLLRKKTGYPSTATALFRAMPPIYLGTMVVAALFIPVGNLIPMRSFPGDVVCFVFLLTGGRFARALANKDSNQTDTLRRSLPELAQTVAIATLVLLTGYTSFERIFSTEASPGILQAIILLTTAYVFMTATTTQTGQPLNHNYQGIDRAMLRLGSWLETAVLAMLSANTAAMSIGLRWWVVAPLAVLIGGFSKGFAETKSRRDFSFLPCALAAVAFLAGWLLRLNIIHL